MRRAILMRPAILLLTALVLALATAGCAARINQMMASWMGLHYSDLIAQWGPPQQVLDDGSGGRILVYTAVRRYSTPGHAVTTYDPGIGGTGFMGVNIGGPSSYTTYTPPQTFESVSYRTFWVDPQGVIYRWAWRGL